MNLENSEYKYALKTIINAHMADVRVVTATCIPEGGFISGSRDNLVKVWIPEGNDQHGINFKESHIFSGATNYIASLCALPPTEQYPKGLFLAGSHDCSIYGFTPDYVSPVFRLLGHSGAVCSLSQGQYGVIVSGSWDKTARVWSGQQCTLTLQGHIQAVWATDVFPSQNLILTGSADHTIRLWRSGICEKVFSGHEDCVRGLAVISDMKFLSCSNDNTVRLWLTNGECLEIFKSHVDYIYSINLLNNKTDFVTCGEDQNIKIWKNGICDQTIVIKPKSLWSVSCLSNENLAVGTSDGKVYVFEKVPVDYFKNASINNVERCKEELLPGSSTNIPVDNGVMDNISQSIYDGETLIVHENGNSDMYICNFYITGTKVTKQALDFQVIAETLYKKSPESESASSSNTSKKTDYEFDVDVEGAIYKLAFNKGENPWDVAHKFVDDHNLLTEHVSQIVEYIIKNTVQSFTNQYFPAKTYFSYVNINIEGLRKKLLEFCQHISNENSITQSQVDDLIVLAHFPDDVSLEQLSALDKVILWNDEFLFPVLDLLRLAVKCKGLQTKISSNEFVNHLLHIFKHTTKNVNKILIGKIFCNMFGVEGIDDVFLKQQEKIFESVKDEFSSGDQSIQKAGSALFLNFAIASYHGFNLSINIYCINITEILNYLVDSEAILRILVAIGTVCTRSSLAVSIFRSLDIKQLLSKFENYCTNEKINKVLKLLSAEF